MADRKVIDVHIHIGGTGDSGSGCRMSHEFIFSFAFAAMLIALKATPFDLNDRRMKELILAAIDGSEKIDRAVLLALDGVYKNGRYLESQSHLVTPNDYVMALAKENPRVLLGASVHPYRKRREMLYETQRCIDHGAVLFKWIPSSQQIDPRDDRCLPFYELLAKANVPLLCHTAAELAVPTSDPRARRLNDPKKLKRALAAGVKVIAAHCATAYLGGVLPDDTDYFDDLLGMLRAAEKKGWDLYADLSAFCTPTRIGRLERINEEIRQGTINPGRFLYGSDFPIPIVDINVFKAPLDLQGLLGHVAELENPLDRNYTILKTFGIHESIFTNASDVLRV
jgi:predicted TIM-barrel fold metal-dependent hydrolase